MIFDEVRFRPAGDRHLMVELGDDASLEVNFRTQAVVHEIEKCTDVVTDFVPSYNSILVQYDIEKINYSRLRDRLKEICGSAPSISDLNIPSRVVTLPVYYMDPWTRECIEEYCRTIAARKYDPEFVAEVNGLSSAEDAVARHARTLHWAVAVSSFPGLPLLRPLDSTCKLVSPKYNPPRTWTPVGAVGVGGTSTAIYTIPSPGGYNLLGRTPTPVWEPEQRSPSFKDNAILLRASDRVKFRPIDLQEYREIESEIARAAYVHDIRPGTFSVKDYAASGGLMK
jgi:urea carboxylase